MATTNNTNPVLGVVIIARHGDRQGFYQSPITYTASATAITPLGEVQSYELGDLMRRTYADPTSATAIAGLGESVLIPTQINATADGGGEGGVIYDSAVAFWQGFYPPTNLNNVSTIALANGTNVTSPLGGFQYIQINAVLPTEESDFEGWTNCNGFTNHTNEWYASARFQAKAAQYETFLASLQPIVGDRNVSLTNMYNIYDYLNVESIHNATVAAAINSTGNSTLSIVRDLASFHEYGSFTDVSPSGIGNVAGRSFLSLVLPSLNTIATETAPVKVAQFQVAYKPFLSLFNLTNIAGSGLFPNPYAMVDYASVAVLEVRKNTAGTGHDVRFGFKNGTSDGEASGVTYYPLFGSDNVDTDLTTFTNNLEPYVLKDNKAWCSACNNTAGICGVYIDAAAGVAALNGTLAGTEAHAHSGMSLAGAGAIGACVTLALGVFVLGAMVVSGLASFGKRRSGRGDTIPLRAGGSYH